MTKALLTVPDAVLKTDETNAEVVLRLSLPVLPRGDETSATLSSKLACRM